MPTDDGGLPRGGLPPIDWQLRLPPDETPSEFVMRMVQKAREPRQPRPDHPDWSNDDAEQMPLFTAEGDHDHKKGAA